MANRIQGLTVEIGGDTTKLASALKCKEAYVVSRALSDYQQIQRLAGIDGRKDKENVLYFEKDSVSRHEKGKAFITEHYLIFDGVKGNYYAFPFSDNKV